MVDVLETSDVPIFMLASPDEEIWARLLNWILKETRLHAQPLACFLLQLSTPQWDILCWT